MTLNSVRVLTAVVADHGWTDAREQRLAKYQRDKSPLVADEAALLFPPRGRRVFCRQRHRV